MIVVRLLGGLGNQLFQYAAARCLAIDKNTEVAFDLAQLYNPKLDDTPRSYMLDNFNLNVKILSSKEILKIHKKSEPRFLNKLLAKANLNPYYYQFYTEEKLYQFSDTFSTLSANSYLLYSYFQNIKYFESKSILLRKELSCPSYQINNTQVTTGIHIRRGDYINLKAAAEFHGSCSPEYYHAAISIISDKFPETNFIVFSEDPEWVKNNINLPPGTAFAANNSDFEDFRQLSFCHHQIIANSSFSWWAAWLNPNAGKIVIAPSKWINGPLDTSGLFPPDWILL